MHFANKSGNQIPTANISNWGCVVAVYVLTRQRVFPTRSLDLASRVFYSLGEVWVCWAAYRIPISSCIPPPECRLYEMTVPYREITFSNNNSWLFNVCDVSSEQACWNWMLVSGRVVITFFSHTLNHPPAASLTRFLPVIFNLANSGGEAGWKGVEFCHSKVTLNINSDPTPDVQA